MPPPYDAARAAKLFLLRGGAGIKLVVLCNYSPAEAVQCTISLRTANMQLLSPFVAAGSEVLHYLGEEAMPRAAAVADRTGSTMPSTSASANQQQQAQRKRAYIQYTLRGALPARALRILACLSRTTSGARDAGVPADIDVLSHAVSERGVGVRSAVVGISSAAYRPEAAAPVNAPTVGAGAGGSSVGAAGAAGAAHALLPELFRCHPLASCA